MIKSIFYNFQSSIGYTLLNTFIVIYTLQYIGVDGRGNISLFLLNVSLIQIFSAIIGASSIGFIFHKTPLSSLILVSTLWCFSVSPVVGAIMFFLEIIPKDQLFETILAAVTLTIIQNILEIFLVNKRYKNYNFLRIIQPIIHLTYIFLFIKISGTFDPSTYINSFIIVLFIVLLISCILLIKKFEFDNFVRVKQTFINCFEIGLVNQINNLVLLFNLRVNYFIINQFLGISLLGVFSILTLLAESIWIFSKSVSTIFFSEVVKTEDHLSIKDVRNKMLRLSLSGTIILLLLVFCIPNFIYAKILGQEFDEIKMVLVFFIPGILAKSINTIYAEYFAVLNKRHINSKSFLIGLLTISIAGFLLTYKYGIEGAAIAGSISQVSSLLFSLYADKKII